MPLAKADTDRLLGDSANGANRYAGSALDTGLRVYMGLAVFHADRGNRAGSYASFTTYTGILINYCLCHSRFPPRLGYFIVFVNQTSFILAQKGKRLKEGENS